MNAIQYFEWGGRGKYTINIIFKGLFSLANTQFIEDTIPLYHSLEGVVDILLFHTERFRSDIHPGRFKIKRKGNDGLVGINVPIPNEVLNRNFIYFTFRLKAPNNRTLFLDKRDIDMYIGAKKLKNNTDGYSANGMFFASTIGEFDLRTPHRLDYNQYEDGQLLTVADLIDKNIIFIIN